MICPLYKAALISNMGKHYDPVIFIDNTRIDETEIIGCDGNQCAWWRRDRCAVVSLVDKLVHVVGLNG